MAKRKAGDKADIKIRLTESLRSKIERAAKRRGVSMNAEMIGRIDRSFIEGSQAFLLSILQNTLYGRQPKFDLDAPGLSFSAEIKALIKQRLTDYVDSLPEPSEPSEPLSPDDVARLRSMLNEAAAKGPSPSIKKRPTS